MCNGGCSFSRGLRHLKTDGLRVQHKLYGFPGIHELLGQSRVIVKARLDQGFGSVHCFPSFFRVLHLLLLHLPDSTQQINLLAGAKQGKGFAVALLDGGEQRCSESAHIRAHLHRLAYQQAETVVRQWRKQIAQDAGNVDARSSGAHHSGNVKRRSEQG